MTHEQAHDAEHDDDVAGVESFKPVARSAGNNSGDDGSRNSKTESGSAVVSASNPIALTNESGMNDEHWLSY